MKKIAFNIALAGTIFLGTGCNKMLDVKDPVNSITSDQVFQTDDQAAIALNGLYSYLINGGEQEAAVPFGTDLYSAGGITIAAAHLADELYHPSLSGQYEYFAESAARLTLQNPGYSVKLWRTAYKGIFNANALIEGVNASTSKGLTEAARKRVLGEALAVRAMSYFYLVNLFGAVPIATSIDFNTTQLLPSAPVAQVYDRIIRDLEDAAGYLAENYEGNNTERIRINKWYVKAMLARVYLFTKNYELAHRNADEVIGQTQLFSLEAPANVFSTTSREVIFQLKQNNNSFITGNATPEGYALTGKYLTPMLLNAFEPGDNRKTAWTNEIVATPFIPGGFSPAKYKLNATNYTVDGYRSEYYVVMRLAEMYLVRAEANLLNNGSKNNSIDDLNEIRQRSGLEPLPYSLTAQQAKDAVAQERRVELFAEWGHRWLDLKRTGKATEVLSQIGYKQPWSAHQSLYPIPTEEIKWANQLAQNDGYQ